MPLKILIILIVLSAVLWSSVYFERSKQNTYTTVNGFLPFAYVYNNQGNINFSENEIMIEALNGSQPRVLIYSPSDNFNWSISATALTATGESHPFAFTIDWQFGGLLVFGDLASGWSYNWYRYVDSTRNWASTGFPIESTLTLGSAYNVKTEFKDSRDAITVILEVSNSTWQKEMPVKIDVPTNFHFDHSDLYIESWANSNGTDHSTAVFSSSQLTSDNYTKQNIISTWLLLIISIATTMITLIGLLVKSKSPSNFRSFLRRNGIPIPSVNIKELKNNLKLNNRSASIAIALFIFFASLQLILAAATNGHSFDIYTMKKWLTIIQSKGVAAIYPYSNVLPPYLGLKPGDPYPPLLAYILYLFPKLPVQENLAELLIKFPAVVANLLLALVVFITFKNREGLTIAIPALLLSLLNFADSSIWGQYDSIVALFMVLAVWLVATKRLELGWIFAGLAICTKQTALVFVPLLLVLSIKQKSWSRLLYGLLMFASVTFFVWYPFLHYGFSFDFALRTSGLGLWSSGGGLDPASPAGGGGTSIWAFNIWPLITLALNGQPLRTGIIGGVKDIYPNQFFTLSYFQLGIALFTLAYLFLATRIWKASKPRDVMLYFGLLMFAFFMLPTRIHERYLIFALSFFPFAYTKSRVIIGSYLVLLVTFLLNLEYGLLTGTPGQNVTGSFVNLIFGDYGLITIISINVIVFVLLLIKTSRIPNQKSYQSEKKGDG